MSWSGRFEAPAIESKTVPELLTMKDELMAELAAVVARLQELERLGIGFPASEPNPKPESGQPGGPNAHPEGADA
jgi:hypothetical protein